MTPRTIIQTAFVIAGLSLAGCRREEATTAPPAPVEPMAVTTVAVGASTARSTSSLPATVAARASSTLSARITAMVVELPRREGESFEAGDVLVRLHDAAVQGGADAAVTAARAAESDLARLRALKERDAATAREVEQAEARAAGARAALLAARDQLSYTTLRAPFAGSVARRPVHVGDVISPGTALVTIEGREGLEVRAAVPAETAARLIPGARLMVRVDGVAGEIGAVVRALSPAGDPATHRVELRADLEAPAGLRSGTFARVSVPDGGAAAGLRVPASAVLHRGGLTGLFVVREGRAWLRWVALGAADGDSVEVRAGLDPGERVSVHPSGLTDGAPVVEAAS